MSFHRAQKRLILAPGVTVLVRDATHLQFGLDATRSGVIASPHAAQLAEIFGGLASPCTPELLIGAIVSQTGVDNAAARSLIDDLVAFRILIPPVRPTVYMVGSSPLAEVLEEHLHEAGFVVRSPRRDESDAVFMASTDPSVPTLVVDNLARSNITAGIMQSRLGLVLPVTLMDHRVIIGPMRNRGRGACIMCLHLTLTDLDHRWHAVATQAQEIPQRIDHSVAIAAAAEVSALLRRVDGAMVPPGVASATPAAGDYVVVDPFVTPYRTEATLGEHESCPVCTHARTRAGSG